MAHVTYAKESGTHPEDVLNWEKDLKETAGYVGSKGIQVASARRRKRRARAKETKEEGAAAAPDVAKAEATRSSSTGTVATAASTATSAPIAGSALLLRAETVSRTTRCRLARLLTSSSSNSNS